MVISIGFVLLGSHLLFMLILSHVCTAVAPGLGLVLFMVLATLSGLLVVSIQTRIDAFFIRRHQRKNPRSGWRGVALRKPRGAAQAV